MSDILIEKLEQVLDEFRKINGGKLDAIGTKLDAFTASVKQISIPEEVTLRHQHTYEHKNINVWVKVMIWVSSIMLVASVSFCWYYWHTYRVDEQTRKYNELKSKNYEWLIQYYTYMSKDGAPSTTVKYNKQHPLPE